MPRTPLPAVFLLTAASSLAIAQPTYLEASATTFGDSNSSPRVVPPDQSANASAGFSGIENIPGSLSMNSINASSETGSMYGLGSVSAFTSNLLIPVGSLFVSAGTTASSTTLARDEITFRWDDGFDDSQPINVQFIQEVVLPEGDPMNSGFNFDAGTSFQLQSSMRIVQESGNVNPGFSQVNINQSQFAFTPGVRSDDTTVSMSDGARVSLTGSLFLSVGGFVRANSDDPANDIFSNEIGLVSFYRIRMVVPDGVIIESDSGYDYNPSDCVADLADPAGVLNFFDVSAFIGLYNAGDPAADLAEPFGTLNFFDVSAYIAAYNAGCP